MENNIVKLAVDTYKNQVEKYSRSDANKLLREALVEANNGKTTLNYKDIRDGKCGGLFSLVEELLSATVVEDLQSDEFFNKMVDFRNLAEGDKNVFRIEDNTLYIVSEAADGTQGIRRQRLGDAKEQSIPTSLKVVKIYEELNRILSGRIDFIELVDRVAKSFRRKLLDDVYTLWNGITANDIGGATFYPAAGSYSESTLLDIIAHVEAAAGGKKATVIGTAKAIRNLAQSVTADSAKEDLYNMGYYGNFYGTPVVKLPQRHKVGSTTFAIPDNVITVIAGDEKPIKCVYEGDPIMIMGDPNVKGDLSQEYFYAEKYGIGLVLSAGTGIGRYEIQ